MDNQQITAKFQSNDASPSSNSVSAGTEAIPDQRRASLGDKIYILCQDSDMVEVWNTDPSTFVKRITITGSKFGSNDCIVSHAGHSCLYVSDSSRRCIWRVRENDDIIDSFWYGIDVKQVFRSCLITAHVNEQALYLILVLADGNRKLFSLNDAGEIDQVICSTKTAAGNKSRKSGIPENERDAKAVIIPGFSIRDFPADGQSGFSAIADQLKYWKYVSVGGLTGSAVRSSILAYIRSEKNWFEDLLSKAFVDKPCLGFNDYVTEMTLETTWIDEPMLTAACRYYNLPIKIVLENIQNFYSMKEESVSSNPAIFLGFVRTIAGSNLNKFVSLIPLNDSLKDMEDTRRISKFVGMDMTPATSVIPNPIVYANTKLCVFNTAGINSIAQTSLVDAIEADLNGRSVNPELDDYMMVVSGISEKDSNQLGLKLLRAGVHFFGDDCKGSVYWSNGHWSAEMEENELEFLKNKNYGGIVLQHRSIKFRLLLVFVNNDMSSSERAAARTIETSYGNLKQYVNAKRNSVDCVFITGGFIADPVDVKKAFDSLNMELGIVSNGIPTTMRNKCSDNILWSKSTPQSKLDVKIHVFSGTPYFHHFPLFADVTMYDTVAARNRRATAPSLSSAAEKRRNEMFSQITTYDVAVEKFSEFITQKLEQNKVQLGGKNKDENKGFALGRMFYQTCLSTRNWIAHGTDNSELLDEDILRGIASNLFNLYMIVNIDLRFKITFVKCFGMQHGKETLYYWDEYIKFEHGFHESPTLKTVSRADLKKEYESYRNVPGWQIMYDTFRNRVSRFLAKKDSKWKTQFAKLP